MKKSLLKGVTQTSPRALAKGLAIGSLSFAISAVTSSAFAQDEAADEMVIEEVIVTGIRGSLRSSLDQKRNSDSLIEVIKAQDIGKLPDQNLAEVLENITGVQITREAGVGTGVQIRGTDENRVQINGVSTVGAGNARGGISFEDIDASIISAVEVIKAPEAKTTEGSVGGTVNLRTIRPLQLKEMLGSIRVQGEKSSLTTDGTTPRISGAWGDNWSTDSGDFGVVISASKTEQDVSHFRPRLDRDNPTDCANGSITCPAGTSHYLGVQFLNQVYINQEYDTTNIAASFEFAPNDNMSFYFDAIINEQERRQESSRVQVSNISRVNGRSDGADGLWATFDTFGTFDLGSFDGPNGTQNLGSIQAVTSGTFSPQQLTDATVDRGAPFLRGSMDSGSRLTDTNLFRLGGDWQGERLSATVEVSRTESDTVNPNLSLTLNFINPNSDRFGTRDENGTPIRFDLRDGISFGINFDDPNAPTVAQLNDPANYVMDSGGTYSANVRENSDTTFRADLSYDMSDMFEGVNSIDFGFRYNNQTSLRDDRNVTAGGTSNFDNSLNGSLIAGLLTPIPDNFGDGTGSSLFIKDVLHFNPELAANPESFVAEINAAIATAGITQNPIGTTLVSSATAFFDVEEKTSALYAQANFEFGIFRGNAGFRYVDTETTATTNSTPGASSSYSFFLPRLNLVADVRDDLVVRAAYSKDINRPDFVNLTDARTFPNRGGVNDVSRVGNPNLKPEEVDSYDISLEYYFAEASVVSIGYFHKTRTSLFGDQIDQPGGVGDVGVGSTDPTSPLFGNGRDVSDPCEAGGIFSSNTDIGIFGSDGGNNRGVCVGDSLRVNVGGETTQSGIELSFQYSLAEFEDTLGWASGFGVIANYTMQDADVNTGFIAIGETRAQAIYDLQGFDRNTNPVTREAATLLNLSEDAYNFTVFYEKHGVTARARYTWRSAYRTDDLPGTSNVFEPLGFRGVVEERGQLNVSASYAVNDHITLSLDAVNLTEEDAPISCVNEGALQCYQGITDRRVIVGASYRF